jgi:hypothetical protein
VEETYTADELTLQYAVSYDEEGNVTEWQDATADQGKIEDVDKAGYDYNEIEIFLYVQDGQYRIVKNEDGSQAVEIWTDVDGEQNFTEKGTLNRYISDSQAAWDSLSKIYGDSVYVIGENPTFYYSNEIPQNGSGADEVEQVSNTFYIVNADGEEIKDSETLDKYISCTSGGKTVTYSQENNSQSFWYISAIQVNTQENFTFYVDTTFRDGYAYSCTITRQIEVKHVATGLVVTDQIYGDNGDVVGWSSDNLDGIFKDYSLNMNEDANLQFLYIEKIGDGSVVTFDDSDWKPTNLTILEVDIANQSCAITLDDNTAAIGENEDADIVVKTAGGGEDEATYNTITCKHAGEYKITYQGSSVSIYSQLPAIGFYRENAATEANLLDDWESVNYGEEGKSYPTVYAIKNENNADIEGIDISFVGKKSNGNTDDISSYYKVNGNAITLTDKAAGNFTITAKITVTKVEGEESWEEEYSRTVYFYYNGAFDSIDDGIVQAGFSGQFVSQEAYETMNFWDTPREYEYWVHADTLQGVIDKLLDQAEKGTVLEGSSGKTYTVTNTGYIWTCVSYSPYDAESKANGTATQYVTTPSGEDGVNGVVMNAGPEYYYLKLNDQDVSPENEEGTSSYEVHDFVNNDNTVSQQYIAFGWFPVNADDEDGEYESHYRKLTGSYKDGFTLDSSDKTEYTAEAILEKTGLHLASDEEQTWLACTWPEVHVDATTEVKVIGKFSSAAEGKSNLYLGFYKDTDIRSMVATSLEDDKSEYDVITAKDIGNTNVKADATNVTYTVRELTAETTTAVETDDFLTADGVSFETETGGNALRNKLNIEDEIAGNEQLKEDIITGTPLEVSLNVKSLEEGDKTYSKDIGAIGAAAKKDNATKIHYLDIGLQYKVGDIGGTITNTSGTINISIQLPADFMKNAKNGKPVVYRYHDGKVTPLSVTYKNGSLSFKSDQFSTYAIAMEESAEGTKAEDTGKDSTGAGDSKVGDIKTVDGNNYHVLSVTADKREVAFVGGDTNATSAAIPPTVTINGNAYTVTEIKDNAFANCKKLTGVSIPATVVKIGKNAFKGCVKLKAITIPSSVKEIGSNAFSGCKKLKKVTIQGTRLTKIGAGAFKKCTVLKSITLPKSLVEIGKNAFNGCKALKKVTFKSTKVKKIGKNAFKGIAKKSTIKVPKKKKTAYKKLLKKSGYKKTVK